MEIKINEFEAEIPVCVIINLSHLETSEIRDAVRREIEYVLRVRQVITEEGRESPFF
jgi:hypothetical protein